MKLERSFYTRDNVVVIARDLLGKYIMTCFDGCVTGGIITESEAYAGASDRASHAYNNKRTARTEVMFGQGGHAYVYLCYGIHSLFNIVTGRENVPHAVLIRGIFPVIGLESMKQRTGKPINGKAGFGPGRVSALLGIHFSHSGVDLLGDMIWLEDRGLRVNHDEMIAGPRVGVEYAGEDAKLPYRFRIVSDGFGSWK